MLEEFKKPYKIQQRDTPARPKDHDLLLRVSAASYCHTDAVLAEGMLSQELPRVGCHEFAGRVVAVGPKVSQDLNIAVGDEVGVPGRAYHPCGVCNECTFNDGDHKGYSPYCPFAWNLGLTLDGGFCDYSLVDSRQVAPIPKGMTALETAPLMCAGLTIWSALERVRDATCVCIVGAGGGLGHLGVQFATHLGKKVVAVDAGDKPIKMLESLVRQLKKQNAAGHVSIHDSRKQDSASVVKQTGGSGVEAVILLPEAQGPFDYGMRLLRDHGTMVVVSFPEKLEFCAKDLVFRDIKIVGSLVGRNHQLRSMLAFAAAHEIRAISKTFTLEELNELVVEYHAGGGGKLIIDMES